MELRVIKQQQETTLHHVVCVSHHYTDPDPVHTQDLLSLTQHCSCTSHLICNTEEQPALNGVDGCQPLMSPPPPPPPHLLSNKVSVLSLKENVILH